MKKTIEIHDERLLSDDLVFYLSAVAILIFLLLVAFDVHADDDFYGQGDAQYMLEHELAQEAFGPYLSVVNRHECDWDRMVCFIEVDELLTSGTDYACLQFAYAMKYITGNGILVYITNHGFVPSARNPIDFGWASQLVDSNGQPVPYIPAY